MSQESTSISGWQGVLNLMFEELRSGSPRAQAYWAQQLAFGPVFMHAVALAVRNGSIPPADLDQIRQVLPFALSMLGALPDDSASFLLLARRQAQVLAWGRRRHLTRLAARLGLDIASLSNEPVPRRFQRPYELLGWKPPEPGTNTVASDRK